MNISNGKLKVINKSNASVFEINGVQWKQCLGFFVRTVGTHGRKKIM